MSIQLHDLLIPHPSMDFDPLELFTPEPSSFTSGLGAESINRKTNSLALQHDEHPEPDPVKNTDEDDTLMPIHIHDMPLLRSLPPAKVLISFLRLLSPETSLNFAPRTQSPDDEDLSISPLEILRKKNVDLDPESWLWLLEHCPRFNTPVKVAAVAGLADSFKKSFTSQYIAWLTQLISSDLAWISEEEEAEIQSLAALRLAENCGRTAQPEMQRSIDIPMLPTKLSLKEPSLTSDNLGLKTWGSSFVLGSRLALQPQKKYLLDPVLELGAGTGLVGMVACCLGFATMLTDLGEIVPNLQSNIELNKIEKAQVAELDWSNPQGFLAKYGNLKFSTIILSDPLYSAQHPPWIVNMLNLFLSCEKGARVLLQVPVRASFEQERASLWELMETNGYIVEEECEEHGYDDFGEFSFIFKKYTRK